MEVRKNEKWEKKNAFACEDLALVRQLLTFMGH